MGSYKYNKNTTRKVLKVIKKLTMRAQNSYPGWVLMEDGDWCYVGERGKMGCPPAPVHWSIMSTKQYRVIEEQEVE
jgi:hypothetical protein